MAYLSSLQDSSLLPLLAYSQALVKTVHDDGDMPTLPVSIATCMRYTDVFDQDTNKLGKSVQPSGLAENGDPKPSLLRNRSL